MTKPMTRATRRSIIKTLFQSYLDDIDDFYDAKDELVSDINKMLLAAGDKDGIVSGEKINEIKEKLRNL